METALNTLIAALKLEQLDDTLFLGRSCRQERTRIYGGEVMAQALFAGQATVTDGKALHSMHAYFVRPGEPAHPIIYKVEIIRDGRSFCTRRITASQHDKAIYFCQASYQTPEEGFEHRRPAPPAPPPEQLEDDNLHTWQSSATEAVQGWPILCRQVQGLPLVPRPEKAAPQNSVWMKAAGPIGDDPHLHQQLLSFASDAYILGTALRPHGLNALHPDMQVATLDHTIWFHRPFRFDDWLLYEVHSPSAGGGRGLGLGHLYDRQGILVASVAQEGLMRPRDRGLLPA